MATADTNPRPALRYDVEVGWDGRVELPGPFQPGQRLTVIVIEEHQQ